MFCNYDISFDPEYYVHRVGRTGRAGKEGKAYSFVAGARDKRLLRQIEDFAKVRVEKYKLPEAKDVALLEVEKLKKQVMAIIDAKQEQFYIKIAEQLIPEGSTETQVLAALMVKLMPPSKHDWMNPSTSGSSSYGRGNDSGGRDRDRGDRGGRGDGGGRDRGRSRDGGGRDDRRPAGRRDDNRSSGGGEKRYSGGSERSWRKARRDQAVTEEHQKDRRDRRSPTGQVSTGLDRRSGGSEAMTVLIRDDRPRYGNDKPDRVSRPRSIATGQVNEDRPKIMTSS